MRLRPRLKNISLTGSTVFRAAERPRGFSSRSGPLSDSEVKARNVRLRDILQDSEEAPKRPAHRGAGPKIRRPLAGHVRVKLESGNEDANSFLESALQERDDPLDEYLEDFKGPKYDRAPVRRPYDRSKLQDGRLLDNGVPLVSPILARDACKCSLCVDASDKQRNFSYADIPTDIQFRSMTPVEGSGEMMVRWRNDAAPHPVGHPTVFDEDTIRKLKKPFRNPRWALFNRPQKLWDASSFRRDTTRVDFNDYMNDPTALAEALHLLWRDGLVFIDGVPESESSVGEIVNRMGPLQETFYGTTWDVRSVPDAKNVAYTAKHLGFHMDLLYMREPPGFQFLHCVHNSCTGGESRFADTFRAVDALYSQNPQHVRTLMNFPVRYEYDNDGYFYSDEKPTVLKRQELNVPPRPTLDAAHPKVLSDVGRVYWSPPFVGSLPVKLWHDELVYFISASKAFADILERPENIVQEKMDSGTCVIFDNLRVVHARNAFDLNSGRRWLRGAYLSRQAFISKAATMMDQMPMTLRMKYLESDNPRDVQQEESSSRSPARSQDGRS